MGDIECLACGHHFRVRSESQSTCPGCGSGGVFRVACWRCKRSFFADALPCITCEGCKEFWTVDGWQPYEPPKRLTGIED